MAICTCELHRPAMDAAVSDDSAIIICAKLCRKTIKNLIVCDCISLNLKLGFNIRSAFAIMIHLTPRIFMFDIVTIYMLCTLLPHCKLAFSFLCDWELHHSWFVHELSSLQLKLMLDITGFKFSHFTSYQTLDSLIDIDFAVPLWLIADFVGCIVFIVFVV